MRQKLLAFCLLLVLALGSLTACGTTSNQNAPAQNDDGGEEDDGGDTEGGDTEGDEEGDD